MGHAQRGGWDVELGSDVVSRRISCTQNQQKTLNHNRLPSVLIRRMCYLCRLFRVTHVRVLKYSHRHVVHRIRWAFELRRPALENSLPCSFACFKRTIIIILLEGTPFNTLSSCSTNLLSKGVCAKLQYGRQLCSIVFVQANKFMTNTCYNWSQGSCMILRIMSRAHSKLLLSCLQK